MCPRPDDTPARYRPPLDGEDGEGLGGTEHTFTVEELQRSGEE